MATDRLPQGFAIQPAQQISGASQLPRGFSIEPPQQPTMMPQLPVQSGLTPGGRQAMPQGQPPQLPPEPSLAERFTEGAANVTQTLLQDIGAAGQRTSPVVRTSEGRLNRALAPEDEQFLYAEQDIVKPGRVVLVDPQDGRAKVFIERTETQEGLAPSAGRVLGVGAMTGPPTARPGLAVPEVGAQGRLGAFGRAKVDPTLGAITQTAPARMAENVLDQTITSTAVMEGARNRSLGQTARAVGEFAQQYGPATSRRQAGEALKTGLGAERGFVKRFKNQSQKLYDAVDQYIPKSTQVPAWKTRRALTETLSRFDNPELGEEFVDPTLKRWAAIIDRADGNISYNDLKQFRTEVGEKLATPSLLKDINERQLSAVYGAMSEDLLNAAGRISPKAKATAQRANKYYRAGRTRIKEALTEILGDKMSEEGAYRFIEQLSSEKGARASAKKLAQIKRSMRPEEWGDVTASLVNQLGVPPPSARVGMDAPTFSPATFMTNYERLAPEARRILFDKTGRADLRGALDDLATVMEAQKNVERMSNPSGTARIVGNLGLGMAAIYDPTMAILGAVGAPVAAALMTNPRFVKWMARIPKAGTTGAAAISHLAKLRPIARGDENVQQFSEQLLQQMQGTE